MTAAVITSVRLSQQDGPLKNIRVDDTVTETRVTVANIAKMFVHHSWAWGGIHFVYRKLGWVGL